MRSASQERLVRKKADTILDIDSAGAGADSLACARQTVGGCGEAHDTESELVQRSDVAIESALAERPTFRPVPGKAVRGGGGGGPPPSSPASEI